MIKKKREKSKRGKIKELEAKETWIQPSFEPEPPLDEKTSFSHLKGSFRASPLAKKIAKEKGIDLTKAKGTGPQGRVMSRDLDLSLKDTLVSFGFKGFPQDKAGSYEEEALNPMRQAIAKRLQTAKTFIPHFYVQQDLDAKSLVSLHLELKENGLKVTLNDFIMRAAAISLKNHPHVNSGFNTVTNQIIRFKTIDIAVAVTLETGLSHPFCVMSTLKISVRFLLKSKSLPF